MSYVCVLIFQLIAYVLICNDISYVLLYMISYCSVLNKHGVFEYLYFSYLVTTSTTKMDSEPPGLEGTNSLATTRDKKRFTDITTTFY